MPQSIAIVGSGLLGMTLAMRLADDGHKVTILEASGDIGGLAATWHIGDQIWDKHYHVTLASDSYTRKLAEDIGLGDEFRWVETKTGFYTDGRLYSMSDTAEFLRFPPLGLIDKLRLGATIFYASRVTNWKELEKVTVEQWLTRLSGKRTFDKIWRPLLRAKLGDAYRETSAAFIWATIRRMYAARNSGLKREMFGYVRGGYGAILARLGEALAGRGVNIALNSPVETVTRTADGRLRVVLASARRRKDAKPRTIGAASKVAAFHASAVAPGFSGAFITEPDPAAPQDNAASAPQATTFDRVIVTAASPVAAGMLPQLSAGEHADMAEVRYQGIVCASVLMRCSLSPYYVTNITDEAPFTGVIEMTAMVDKRELGGNTLIYLPKYASPDDEIFTRTDDEIEATFLDALQRMYPHFRRDEVIAFKVSRVKQVFPLPTLNYSAHITGPRTSIEGVYVVNSSHITNGTLNVNETVALAENFYREHFGGDVRDLER
ncbi:MAG: NAD(P)/FAD-dependent oxidoreductase [Acidobacteria bacterium]|nr:NAD(P)/FAD-dependent oxidoreductase [Acidobacteriota bacterium]MCW5949739.1 NAD(P)/FAD-dependent oxidoreductase [Pyrinomonadaceae bacterium]